MAAIACGRCGAIAGAGTAVCATCGARLTPVGLEWQRPDRVRLVTWAVAILAVVAAVGVAAVVFWIYGQPPAPCSQPGCVSPPVSEPFGPADPYASTTYHYSLDAAGTCPGRMSVTERSGEGLHWAINLPGGAITWPVELRGEPAAGRSADEIVKAEAAARYAGSTFVYDIPMAEIGFKPGSGSVSDMYMSAGSSGPVHARAIIMAAVSGDLAIIVDGLGPWYQPAPPSHPNPAETKAPICFAGVLTSVTWPGGAPP